MKDLFKKLKTMLNRVFWFQTDIRDERLYEVEDSIVVATYAQLCVLACCLVVIALEFVRLYTTESPLSKNAILSAFVLIGINTVFTLYLYFRFHYKQITDEESPERKGPRFTDQESPEAPQAKNKINNGPPESDYN